MRFVAMLTHNVRSLFDQEDQVKLLKFELELCTQLTFTTWHKSLPLGLVFILGYWHRLTYLNPGYFRLLFKFLVGLFCFLVYPNFPHRLIQSLQLTQKHHLSLPQIGLIPF